MSKIIKGEITCPVCSNKEEHSSYSSMNVSITPDLKSKFLSNDWNTFKCSKCGASMFITEDMMYHDMDKQFIVWYIPSGNIDEKVQSLKKYDSLFEKDNYFLNPIIVTSREDAILMVHLCDKNGPPTSKEREKDYFEMIQEMKNLSQHKMNKIDPKEYPTLATYQPEVIEKVVLALQAKYPDMTEGQCLLNLEMDLAEQDQLARGK